MDEKQRELIELTQKLVSIDSTNIGKFEYEIAAFIEDWLEKETGIKAKRDYIIDDRYNVVIEKQGTKQDGKDLVIICHMDTVPHGNNWDTDPLSGVIVEEDGLTKLYGRGAVDMKAGLAVGMIAFRDAVNSGKNNQNTIRFIASADEEIEMLGAIKAVESGYITKDSLAFDVEPTGEEIVPGHKGKIWFNVKAFGKPAHGSTPWEGIPAILAISQIVCAIENEINALAADEFFGQNSVCFGKLTSGDNINVVADKASLEIDVRFVPPYKAEDFEDMMKRIFEQVKGKVPGIVLDYDVISTKPCIEIHEEAELVKAFEKGVMEEEGRDIKATMTTAYTDTGVAAGMTGNINCLSYGPCGGGIHQNNEWADCDSMYRVYKVVKNVIGQLVY